MMFEARNCPRSVVFFPNPALDIYGYVLLRRPYHLGINGCVLFHKTHHLEDGTMGTKKKKITTL
jgi:hypothetical protein